MLYNTILINVSSNSKYLEGTAATVLTPGMLTKRNTEGKWKAHDVAGGACQPIFVIEDIWGGETIHDDYSIGESSWFRYCNGGDMIWGWLAVGEDIAIGDFLISSGINGTLKKIGVSPVAGCIVAVALEAVVTVATIARIKIEIFK